MARFSGGPHVQDIAMNRCNQDLNIATLTGDSEATRYRFQGVSTGFIPDPCRAKAAGLDHLCQPADNPEKKADHL